MTEPTVKATLELLCALAVVWAAQIVAIELAWPIAELLPDRGGKFPMNPGTTIGVVGGTFMYHFRRHLSGYYERSEG